jgi:hypothetical protein
MRRIAASAANPFEIADTERRTLRPVSIIAASAARRGRTITIVDNRIRGSAADLDFRIAPDA